MVLVVKNLPASAGGVRDETRVWSLGQRDSLEQGMASTPVFLSGESHGQRSLVGYSPWGHKESDTTEATWHMYTNTHVYTSRWFILLRSRQRFRRAPGLSSLSFSQYPLLSILHTVIFMPQCYSPSSSHRLLPPLWPQVSSLCLLLYCRPACRFIRTIFLGFIYIC